MQAVALVELGRSTGRTEQQGLNISLAAFTQAHPAAKRTAAPARGCRLLTLAGALCPLLCCSPRRSRRPGRLRLSPLLPLEGTPWSTFSRVHLQMMQRSCRHSPSRLLLRRRGRHLLLLLLAPESRSRHDRTRGSAPLTAAAAAPPTRSRQAYSHGTLGTHSTRVHATRRQ
jgi:hypothetical protein